MKVSDSIFKDVENRVGKTRKDSAIKLAGRLWSASDHRSRKRRAFLVCTRGFDASHVFDAFGVLYPGDIRLLHLCPKYPLRGIVMRVLTSCLTDQQSVGWTPGAGHNSRVVPWTSLSVRTGWWAWAVPDSPMSPGCRNPGTIRKSGRRSRVSSRIPSGHQ